MSGATGSRRSRNVRPGRGWRRSQPGPVLSTVTGVSVDPRLGHAASLALAPELFYVRAVLVGVSVRRHFLVGEDRGRSAESALGCVAVDYMSGATTQLPPSGGTPEGRSGASGRLPISAGDCRRTARRLGDLEPWSIHVERRQTNHWSTASEIRLTFA
jgi:hypothetical protein